MPAVDNDLVHRSSWLVFRATRSTVVDNTRHRLSACSNSNARRVAASSEYAETPSMGKKADAWGIDTALKELSNKGMLPIE